MDLMETSPRAGQLSGYIPVAVKWINAKAQVDWAYVGDARFTAPFFDETIRLCMQRPLNLAFRPLTGLKALHACAESQDCLNPTAFIFHMSRCGSTLLSQMLAAVPQNLVISEAPPIDRILAAKRFNPSLTTVEHVAMLRAVVRCLGQRRHIELNRYFIKLDAWHVCHLDLIRQAFPDTPWVFLYRNPLEVLVSNLDEMAGAAMPGSAEHVPPNVNLLDALTMPIEQYMSLVLENILRNALIHQKSPQGLFVNYQDLPLIALPSILRHFGMPTPDSEIAQMRQKTRFHAKQPRETFSPDTERKQREATETARFYSATILDPLYQQMESLRWRA